MDFIAFPRREAAVARDEVVLPTVAGAAQDLARVAARARTCFPFHSRALKTREHHERRGF